MQGHVKIMSLMTPPCPIPVREGFISSFESSVSEYSFLNSTSEERLSEHGQNSEQEGASPCSSSGEPATLAPSSPEDRTEGAVLVPAYSCSTEDLEVTMLASGSSPEEGATLPASGTQGSSSEESIVPSTSDSMECSNGEGTILVPEPGTRIGQGIILVSPCGTQECSSEESGIKLVPASAPREGSTDAVTSSALQQQVSNTDLLKVIAALQAQVADLQKQMSSISKVSSEPSQLPQSSQLSQSLSLESPSPDSCQSSQSCVIEICIKMAAWKCRETQCLNKRS